MTQKINIDAVADLARLKLSAEEKEKLSGDLANILGYVEQLSRLDTQNTPPTSHVLNLENVFRPDEAKPSSIREDVLKHAPKREANFFKVPKIIDQ